MSLGKVYGVRLPLATEAALEALARRKQTTVVDILRRLAIVHGYKSLPVNKTGAESGLQDAASGDPVSVATSGRKDRATQERRAKR